LRPQATVTGEGSEKTAEDGRCCSSSAKNRTSPDRSGPTPYPSARGGHIRSQGRGGVALFALTATVIEFVNRVVGTASGVPPVSNQCQLVRRSCDWIAPHHTLCPGFPVTSAGRVGKDAAACRRSFSRSRARLELQERCTTWMRSGVGRRGPYSTMGSMWSVDAGSSGVKASPQMAQKRAVARAWRDSLSHRAGVSAFLVRGPAAMLSAERTQADSRAILAP
jgi:hypothetical protein